MLPLTQHGLAANYDGAAALTKQHSPQDHFSARPEQTPDWAIGPFDRDSSLTFTPTSQWPDPTGIGWTASAIFNPSLIRHDGRLVVFYRASPSMESTASRIGMAVTIAPQAGPTVPAIRSSTPPGTTSCTAARTGRSIARMDGTSSSTTPSFPSTPMMPVAIPRPTTPSRTSGANQRGGFRQPGQLDKDRTDRPTRGLPTVVQRRCHPA